MATDTIVNNLVINKLTKAQYDAIDNPSDTELYLVPDEVDSTPVSGSSNCVTSGGVYNALNGKQDTLVSGDSLRYVDGLSLLGGGSIYSNPTRLKFSSAFHLYAHENFYLYSLVFEYSETELIGSAKSKSTDTNKELTTTDFNPFGLIGWCDGSDRVAEQLISGNDIYILNTGVDLRYAFNTGTTLIENKNVYIKCVPVVDNSGNRTGRVRLATGLPITQDLPTTEDGFVYIFLGIANNDRAITLTTNHPIYEFKNSALRLWTNSEDFSDKQDLLISGTNIKTINNVSLLGSGDISTTTVYGLRGTLFSPTAKGDIYNRSILFQYSDSELVGSATSYTNTDNKELTTLDFNPFGTIAYANNLSASDGDALNSSNIYYQVSIDLRYGFKIVANPLVSGKIVYIKCEPLVDASNNRTGRVRLATGQPVVQDPPTTADGFVYIQLGWAISETNIFVIISHPIYEYKSGAIRLWTNQEEHLALTSEEIDRDIIQVVTWEDSAFKLAVTNASSSGYLSIAPGDFVEGEYILPQLDLITTLPNYFPSQYSTTTFTSGDDLGKFTNLTAVPNNAFYGCSNITSIIIPDKVTTISSLAFYNCTSLESITLPEGLTTIGSGTFQSCSSLESITIPDSVLYIEGGGSFLNSGIKSATIGDGVTELTNGVFWLCLSLEEVTIGSGVTTISNSAFVGCSSLETINFGENISYIGGSAFSNCTSLESVEFPSSLRTLDGSAFGGCSNLSEITLNEGLLTIGLAVFSGTNIASVVIPSTVTTIGSGCFNNSVFSLIDFGNTRATILSKASNVYFWNNGGSTPTPTIVVPDSLVEDWKADSGWSSLASYIVGYSEYHSND